MKWSQFTHSIATRATEKGHGTPTIQPRREHRNGETASTSLVNAYINADVRNRGHPQRETRYPPCTYVRHTRERCRIDPPRHIGLLTCRNAGKPADRTLSSNRLCARYTISPLLAWTCPACFESATLARCGRIGVHRLKVRTRNADTFLGLTAIPPPVRGAAFARALSEPACRAPAHTESRRRRNEYHIRDSYAVLTPTVLTRRRV